MAYRADLESALTRIGRRHGWNVTTTTLGYYRLHFTRSDGTVRVRTNVVGRIAEVTVDICGNRHQLSLPARQRLEEILTTPPPRPDGLTERLVVAVVDNLAENDPLVTIGVGEDRLDISWGET